MKSLLWFGDIGRRNSFSKLSESILENLKNEYDIYALVPPEDSLVDTTFKNKYKTTHVGEMMGTFNWLDFRRLHNAYVSQSGDHALKMKYSLLQAAYIINENNIDYMIIMGEGLVCETFMSTINQTKSFPCKIIVIPSFEYIPSYNCIKNILKSDLILATNPVIVDSIRGLSSEDAIEIEDLNLINDSNINWICHGVSDNIKNLDRKECIKSINDIREKLYGLKKPIEYNDVIILNANNFVERKNIEDTVDVYLNVLEGKKYKKLKLWLHTDTKSDEFKGLYKTKLEKHVENGNIIVTHNNVDDSFLNKIYNICQVGFQTSSGEGWSLTNCEHESVGGIQVVPNFLATGFLFSKYLIPVTLDETKDDSDNKITVCKMSQQDIQKTLEEALDNLEPANSTISEDYTWKKASDKLIELMGLL